MGGFLMTYTLDHERTKNLIKDHEGCILLPYKDTVNVTTIGFGRNLQHNGISAEEADYLFDNDFSRALDEAKGFSFWHNLSSARKTVVVDMLFNIGKTRFLGFRRMIAALEAGDYNKAAIEMLDSVWARQVKGRANMLAKMMKSGTWS